MVLLAPFFAERASRLPGAQLTRACCESQDDRRFYELLYQGIFQVVPKMRQSSSDS